MSYKKTILVSILAIFLFAPRDQARAMDCFADPVYDLNQTAKVIIGARVRDVACMEGSLVLKTLTVGKSVHVIGSTDGWYKVEDGGVQGWVGMTLVQITNADGWTEASAPVEGTVQIRESAAPGVVDSNLTSRLKGYILLQVQQHGEAWYVNPSTSKRYYLKDGPTAYEMMRAFGLGITNADLLKVQNGDPTLVARLKGRILLQVQAHGEAYYINPKDGTAHYMQDGAAAYEIMRYLSLGITDVDLNKIPSKEFVPITSTSASPSPASTVATVEPVAPPVTIPPATVSNPTDISLSAMQKGGVPAGVDLMDLNIYWLDKVNALRAEKGLRQLVLDQRFMDTSTEWAGYLGENDLMTHTRPDGKTMHQWIDTKGLAFTVRNSPGGWVTNYFTENIAYGYSDGTQAGIKKAMDESLAMFLAEGATGAHYRTIYHADWNSVGLGFYFKDNGNGTYKVFQVFHYGSLQH